MDSEKPIIVFTSFWDAEKIVENGGFFVEEKSVHFTSEEVEVLSVALAQPKGFRHRKLDFFCPTWDILKSYRKDRNWETYTKEYQKILV